MHLLITTKEHGRPMCVEKPRTKLDRGIINIIAGWRGRVRRPLGGEATSIPTRLPGIVGRRSRIIP